ncbi:MAG: RluA family pseudouridine synthase, partial [Deltaproteobacteria bacterium]|nr:RluA family pseudouridine synthase [Deltaproteobacteria bacterium]
RTHQIRIHMSELGHPVVGDKLYGSPSGAIKRQALHAWRVEFEHPVTRKRMKIEAPIPDDMARLIDGLRSGV